MIESTVGPDGAKTVIQKAFNRFGKLVEFDVKTP
jgi:hypothetical protein